jgi:CheY-like chemotaxis protein
MAERTDLRKLLVLHGPGLEAVGNLDFLREHFQVETFQSLDDALAAMRQRPFDAVLAEMTGFLPLERGIVTQHASIVLDTIGDGIGIVGPSGELVWANRRLRDLSPATLAMLQEVCKQAYEEFAIAAQRDPERGRRFSLKPDGSTYYEVICSPIRDRQGLLRQVVAVVVDATTQRRQQLKINAIDRAGRELVRLDYQALSKRDAAQRLRLLEERIIGYSKDVLNYEHFALLLLDERTNRLEMLVLQGLGETAERYELFANPEGNGICGYVAATGRSYVCPDVRGDARYLPGLEGARSSLTVPLRLHDKVIGVLNAESRSVGAFGEEDRQFAEIFSNYIALALHILNLLVFERHHTHTQVSGSICTELAGPLNDLVTEATELMEDYIGHDHLRKRLGEIIDRASQARKRIGQFMQAPSTGVIAMPSEPIQPDPVLTGKRILVAEDEELMRQTIRDVLVPYGCQVDLARDGAEALAMLGAARYDLVVSDIKMPGATGYDIYSAVKQANPNTPVILITGFGYDPHHSILRTRQEGGVSAVLMKPFKVKQLLDECRVALQPPPVGAR